MNKKTILLAVVGLALFATAGMAQAPTQEGQIYIKADATPVVLVDMPMSKTTGEPSGDSGGGIAKAATTTTLSTTAGPTSLGSDSLVPGGGGSAIVMPRGSGPMYSPKQHADREISRLIRKLG